MTERRRGLGRGLGALIPADAPGAQRPRDVFFSHHETPAEDKQPEVPGHQDVPASNPHGAHTSTPHLRPVPGARFAELSITDIATNPRQPRQEFDEDELQELAHSIASVGVLQPVVVRAASSDAGIDATFELIMGERRWRACRLAGMDTIPAIVRDTQDDDLLRDALLENLHRSQLHPLEEAAAYAQLLEDFGCTHEELASRLGRSRPQISNTIRLLRLPGPVQRRVAAGVLSAGHARALLTLDSPQEMESLASRIVAEGLSVRSVEEIVLLTGPAKTAGTRRRHSTTQDPEVAQWSAWLSDRLDTRVTIAVGQRKGRLSVDFASKDDLERILGLLDPSRGDASTT